MLGRLVWAALGAAGVMAWAGNADAALLVDGHPTGRFADLLQNNFSANNWLVEFQVAGTVSLTGLGVYTIPTLASIGQQVVVRVRNDVGGVPDAATNLYEFTSTIDQLAGVSTLTTLAVADFAPQVLTSGTYWIGMMGTASELGWESFLSGFVQPSNQAALFREGPNVPFGPHPALGVLAFALYGDGPGSIALVPATELDPDVIHFDQIPEPTTWAMMLVGFFGLGSVLRLRRSVGATT